MTADPEQGLRFAAVAYDIAQWPVNRQGDPTAAGEAAAKASFRSQQLGRDPATCNDWLERTLNALPGNSNLMRRERVATLLLDGRGRAVRLLREYTSGQQVTEAEVSELHIFGSFALAERTLRQVGDRRDPYGPMLDRHRATIEAVLPNMSDAPLAARLALRGMFRAVTSRRESANTPSDSGPSTMAKHARFVTKQFSMNGLALALAASKLLGKRSQRIDTYRRSVALRMLG